MNRRNICIFETQTNHDPLNLQTYTHIDDRNIKITSRKKDSETNLNLKNDSLLSLCVVETSLKSLLFVTSHLGLAQVMSSGLC